MKITYQGSKNLNVQYIWYVQDQAEKMICYLNKKYGHDFDCRIKTKAGGRSWGGEKGISISDRYAANKIQKFREYKSIANDPVIGEFFGTSEQCTLAVVAHEIAHWWHHNLKRHEHGPEWYRGPVRKDPAEKPHGPKWQSIYAELREKFLNNQLEKLAA